MYLHFTNALFASVERIQTNKQKNPSQKHNPKAWNYILEAGTAKFCVLRRLSFPALRSDGRKQTDRAGRVSTALRLTLPAQPRPVSVYAYTQAMGQQPLQLPGSAPLRGADGRAAQTGSGHAGCLPPGKGLVHAEVKDKLLLNRGSEAIKFQLSNQHRNIPALSIKKIYGTSEVKHRWGLKSHFLSLYWNTALWSETSICQRGYHSQVQMNYTAILKN